MGKGGFGGVEDRMSTDVVRKEEEELDEGYLKGVVSREGEDVRLALDLAWEALRGIARQEGNRVVGSRCFLDRPDWL